MPLKTRNQAQDDRQDQQGAAVPDERHDPGQDRQHPADQVQPFPAVDPASGQHLGDAGHREGDPGEHRQGEQAADNGPEHGQPQGQHHYADGHP